MYSSRPSISASTSISEEVESIWMALSSPRSAPPPTTTVGALATVTLSPSEGVRL